MRSSLQTWAVILTGLTIEQINSALGTVSLLLGIGYTARLLWVSFRAKK